MLLIILGIFILVISLIVQYLGSFEILKIKNLTAKKHFFISLIPLYGHFYVKKLPFMQKEFNIDNYNYLYSFKMILKRILAATLITILTFIILIPLSVSFYLSFKNNAMRSIFYFYLFILFILVNQGLSVDYAQIKGYDGLKYGLIGLIPILSFFIINKICKKKSGSVRNEKISHVLNGKNIFSRILIQGEIALLSIIVIIPVIYIFGLAFSDIKTGVPSTIWPEKPNLNAFFRLLNETKFKIWYKNTIIIALINMFVGTIIITGAAYVFARFKFKGKKAGLLSILVLQAFPSFMGLLAMYILFWKFGLLGKPTALTILYIGGSIPGNIWLIKGFLDQIPKDLDESAEIDGANKLKIFTKIILPLAVPILAFVAVSMFMSPWMDYMLPGYLLNHAPKGAPANYDIQQQWTLAVGIFNFVNDINSMDYSAFAAASIIVGMPIALLYMAFQKYLIEGIMAGATKG